MRRTGRCRSVALFLPAMVTVAAPALAGDLLIPATGERRAGTLASCDDESCRFDGKAVPLAGLLWIGLGVGGDGEELPPRGIASPGAVLGNGTLTAGRLVGLSQGTIVLDTVELDRSAVRWLRIAAVPPAVDVLVRRDGALRTGALQGCAAGSCTMAGVAATRAELAWIGLGVSPETIVLPATPQNPAKDMAQFVDGSTRVTPLVGVGAGNVVLGIGTFPRVEIAWIYLAPPTSEGGPPVIRDPPAQTPPPTPAPPPPPQPAPPSPPGPQPSPDQGGLGETGALWIGTLHEREIDRSNAANVRTSLFALRLREVNVFPLWIQLAGKWQKVGRNIGLRNEGSSVTTQETFNSGSMRCSGQGSLAMDTPGPAGHYYLKNRDVDVSSALGYDIPLAGGRYAFATFASGEYTYPGTCVEEGRTNASNFYHPVIWVSHLNPDFDSAGLVDPEARGFVQGRMQGSFSATDGFHDLAVSWMLCREGDACPPPPELPEGPTEDFDPCGRSGQQAALRDTCHAQLDSLLDDLAPALAEYNAEMKLAEANRAEFERAQDFCELYDKAKEVLEAIISGGTGPAAEAARALVYLRDVIEKVQDGELASMLYPEQVATYLGYYAKAKAIWFEVTASEIDKMQRDLDGCSGKVPIDTYMAAKKFLEHFSAAKRVWDSKVAPGLNDLRTKGLECAGLDHAAWRACLDDAECRGVPPACGPEPTLEGAYD